MTDNEPTYMNLCSENRQYEQLRACRSSQSAEVHEEKHNIRMQMNIAYQVSSVGREKKECNSTIKINTRRKILCVMAVIMVLNVLITIALIATSVASSVTIQSLRSQIAQQSGNNATNDQHSDAVSENVADSAMPQDQSEINLTTNKVKTSTEYEITSESTITKEMPTMKRGMPTTQATSTTTVQPTLHTPLEAVEVSSCGPGLWWRVAYLNMSDPSHQCPPVWREYSANGVRACGRPANTSGCFSMNYSSITPYAKVCGRVIGYQVGSPDVFNPDHFTIDDTYVDGVSVTYGDPRNHIWTYAGGLSEYVSRDHAHNVCPCRLSGTSTSYQQKYPPNFVGNDYYCESGNPENSFENTDTLRYTDDPLWDGLSCEGWCCSDGRNPPWFSVQLREWTLSDIEVRICGHEETFNDDTPLKLVELYIGEPDRGNEGSR